MKQAFGDFRWMALAKASINPSNSRRICVSAKSLAAVALLAIISSCSSDGNSGSYLDISSQKKPATCLKSSINTSANSWSDGCRMIFSNAKFIIAFDDSGRTTFAETNDTNFAINNISISSKYSEIKGRNITREFGWIGWGWFVVLDSNWYAQFETEKNALTNNPLDTARPFRIFYSAMPL